MRSLSSAWPGGGGGGIEVQLCQCWAGVGCWSGTDTRSVGDWGCNIIGANAQDIGYWQQAESMYEGPMVADSECGKGYKNRVSAV